MHVDVDMAQRQPYPPLPYPPVKEQIWDKKLRIIEAALWNGPAHAD